MSSTETKQDCVELPSYVPDCSTAESHLKDYIPPMKIEIKDCQFSFKCPKKWDSLQTTENVNVRYCDACQEHVWFCKTNKALRYAVSQGRCVAVEVVSKIPIIGNIPVLGRVGNLSGTVPEFWWKK